MESSGSRLEGPRVWDVGNAQGVALAQLVAAEGALPADAVSVTLLAETSGSEIVTIGISDAQGRVLVDPASPETSPNRVVRMRGSAVAMIPTATAALPLARDYRVVASGAVQPGATAGAARLTAWVKRAGRAGAAPAVQELPLALAIVGDAPPDEARVAVALGELGRILRQADVETLEPVRRRLDGMTGARFTRVHVDPRLGSDSPDVTDLLRLSTDEGGARLTVFVVPDIVTSGGLSIWALSGSVPVPPMPGTPRSGIVASAVLFDLDPVFAGQVLAHEIGHALGLYHTTEGPLLRLAGAAPAAVHDQLDDTPACPTGADADGSGVLTGGECERHGADNLMFWAASRNGTGLTRGQAEIIRRSALVR